MFNGDPGRASAAAWWRDARAAALQSCAVDDFATCLAAAGSPNLPRGELAALRDDLARAFADSFGVFFARYAEDIAVLPPFRRPRRA